MGLAHRDALARAGDLHPPDDVREIPCAAGEFGEGGLHLPALGGAGGIVEDGLVDRRGDLGDGIHGGLLPFGCADTHTT